MKLGTGIKIGGLKIGEIAFSPLSLSNLQLWLQADAGVSYNSSNQVSQWRDQSGNGKIAQASFSGANAPVYVENSINNKPSIRLDNQANEGQSYFTINEPGFNLKNSTAFVVARQNNRANNDYARMLSFLPNSGEDYDTNDGLAFLYNNQDVGDQGLQLTSNFNNAFYTDGLADSEFALASYVIRPSGIMEVFYNNYDDISSQNSSMAATMGVDLLIGQGSQLVTASSFDGNIAEIIIYGQALSEADMNKINNYLNSKYNIY